MKVTKELIEVFVDEVCMGIHTALRKVCESGASHEAWQAIRDMPDKEWAGAVRWAAPYILEAIAKEVNDEEEARSSKGRE